MSITELDSKSLHFKQKQLLWQFGFVVVLISALVASILAFQHAKNQALKAQKIELDHQLALEKQRSKSNDLDPDHILAQIETYDEEAFEFTRPENPSVYLWKVGLHPKTTSPSPAFEADQGLIKILNARRFLIGSIGGLTLSSSSRLSAYLCGHMWFVIGESVKTPKPDEWLKAQIDQDPRFSTTALVTGPIHPSDQGLVVGWFLGKEDAEKLVREIDKVDSTKPFMKRWDFGTYQPNCPTDKANSGGQQ